MSMLRALTIAAQIHDPKTPDLSRLSRQDACDVLRLRATELDVQTLSTEWQSKIANMDPGVVPGVSDHNFSRIICTLS